ncbi:MAG: nucleotidyltransferase domain-containing protein [Acetobacteraceae bacterium]
MTEKPPDDPVLKRFRAAVVEIYGRRVKRVMLYGSRARGEHRPDSDYDVAVFLRGTPERAKEMARLAEVETDILYDTGAVINALPFPAAAYRERTGFMSELRKDGLDL